MSLFHNICTIPPDEPSPQLRVSSLTVTPALHILIRHVDPSDSGHPAQLQEKTQLARSNESALRCSIRSTSIDWSKPLCALHSKKSMRRRARFSWPMKTGRNSCSTIPSERIPSREARPLPSTPGFPVRYFNPGLLASRPTSMTAQPQFSDRSDDWIRHTGHDHGAAPALAWRANRCAERAEQTNGAVHEPRPWTPHDHFAFAALAIQQVKQFEDAKKAEVVTLLGDIGHEMKNLLTPVYTGMELLRAEVIELFGWMGSAELSEKKVSKEICDEAGEMAQNRIRRLHDRVKEMADCVKGLNAPPNFALCAVELVILEVFQTLQVLAREKQITLRTDGLESLSEFHADERRLCWIKQEGRLTQVSLSETPFGYILHHL